MSTAEKQTREERSLVLDVKLSSLIPSQKELRIVTESTSERSKFYISWSAWRARSDRAVYTIRSRYDYRTADVYANVSVSITQVVRRSVCLLNTTFWFIVPQHANGLSINTVCVSFREDTAHMLPNTRLFRISLIVNIVSWILFNKVLAHSEGTAVSDRIRSRSLVT